VQTSLLHLHIILGLQKSEMITDSFARKISMFYCTSVLDFTSFFMTHSDHYQHTNTCLRMDFLPNINRRIGHLKIEYIWFWLKKNLVFHFEYWINKNKTCRIWLLSIMWLTIPLNSWCIQFNHSNKTFIIIKIEAKIDLLSRIICKRLTLSCTDLKNEKLQKILCLF
jgi:hypothetical protein